MTLVYLFVKLKRMVSLFHHSTESRLSLSIKSYLHPVIHNTVSIFTDLQVHFYEAVLMRSVSAVCLKLLWCSQERKSISKWSHDFKDGESVVMGKVLRRLLKLQT